MECIPARQLLSVGCDTDSRGPERPWLQFLWLELKMSGLDKEGFHSHYNHQVRDD
jgi:hypothetical protein